MANMGVEVSTGDVLLFVGGAGGCWEAPRPLFLDALVWYYAAGEGGGARGSLTAFAEDLDGAGGDYAGQFQHAVGGLPADVGQQWKSHWWWGGHAPALPRAAWDAVGGFAGEDGLAWEHETAHLMDKCRIARYDVWLAPARLAWGRREGECACREVGRWAGEGFEQSLVMLGEMRRGERRVKASR